MIIRCLLFSAILTSLGCASHGGPSAKYSPQQPKSAEISSSTLAVANVPIDPITGIIDAFRSHSIVALGEGDHGNEQGAAFRLSLIRDPRFGTIVNDVVVEFGNSLYQDIMDRFIQGEDVPYSSLKKAWQNTTQQFTWDAPIYEEFFRAVREVNLLLPHKKRLRVLLGDPPIDWDDVHKPEDALIFGQERDTSAVDIIRKEVLAKNRRALIIYGGMHFVRKKWEANSIDEGAKLSMVTLLQSHGVSGIFSIWTNTHDDIDTLQADIASWSIPSLTLLHGTNLGHKDFAVYFSGIVGMDANGPIRAQEGIPMEDQFDALLYLGPISGITQQMVSVKLCKDPQYMAMRVHRMSIFDPSGGEWFKEYCAKKIKAEKKDL